MGKDKTTDISKAPAMLEMKPKAKSMRKLNAGLPAVTVEEVDNVRRHVLDTVKNNIPNARAVLGGRLKWTNQQVKLFQILLNKVLPDLSASMNEHIHRRKPLKEMTREELQEFIAESQKAEREDPSDPIDAVYSEIPEASEDEAVDLMDVDTDDDNPTDGEGSS